MAFPTVVEITGDSEAGNVLNHSWDFAAAPDEGDQCLIGVITDGGSTISNQAAGYNELFNATHATDGTPTMAVYEKVAGSSESQTFTFDTSGTQRSSGFLCRFTGAGTPEVSSSVSSPDGAPNDSPDPDSKTASGGSADNLWLAFCGHDDGRDTVDAGPTTPGTWTNLQNERVNNSAGVGAGIKRSENATATVDPNVFTLSSSSEEWMAITIVIPPAAAAGGINPALLQRTKTLQRIWN